MKHLLLAFIFFVSVNVSAGISSGIAPDFTLASNTGNNVRLAEHRGEVIMLNFWASWCAPCRQEMPHLRALHEQYEPLGFKLLGINVDENTDDAKKAIAKLKISFPVLFDSNNEIAERFKVDAMPTTIIIDRDGNIRHLHRGYKPGYENDYQQQISQLIKEF